MLLKCKNLQSDWPRAFLHLTWETQFSQTCGFNRIIKAIMVYDLNSKNLHINGLFLQIPKNPIFGVFWGIIPKRKFFPKNPALPVFTLQVCVHYFLSIFYFFTKWYPFKNYEKCFLLHLKSSLRSREIFVFFSLPFHTFQIQKDKWKWNNLWCHELACTNFQMYF